MTNPWLSIPLGDYEGHMGSADVQQLEALSELFGEALAIRRPESVAVLGIAGGNGLEHIDPRVTKRVVGLDIHPDYLETVRVRYGELEGLELHCVDLAETLDGAMPVALVHAALVLEHAGATTCLENAAVLVEVGGALSVVLQLPSETEQTVAASGFDSMQRLKSHFALISPTWLVETLAGRGFRLECERSRAVARGKGLWMGVFAR